jgi:2-furoyl-CoA dehydrogenase FAD binding subunit
MKPAQFDYVRAGSVEQATALLAQHGARARILAGGQSLMAMLNIRLAEPALLIDISGLGGLRELRIDGDWVEIGAGVTQAELLAWPALATELPLLAMALPSVGHFQTRNRGTVCGSLAHSDPSSELPLCLALLGGEVVLRSQRGTRRLRGQAFQTGMLSTAREVDELLLAVRFPRARPGQGFAFHEVARRHGDFAIVALAVSADAGGATLAVGGVADTPALCKLGLARGGSDLSGAELDAALNAFAWEMGGNDDLHATARYRRELVRRLAPGLIAEALQRRGQG